MSDTRYQSFAEFWPFYLGEHRNPVNRVMHVAGTTMALGTLALSVATMNPLLLPVAAVVGYGPAWVGHFFVEKNKPASFKYPLWSFVGDMKMLGLFYTGKLGNELESLGFA